MQFSPPLAAGPRVYRHAGLLKMKEQPDALTLSMSERSDNGVKAKRPLTGSRWLYTEDCRPAGRETRVPAARGGENGMDHISLTDSKRDGSGVCLCGNTPLAEGFYPCKEQGEQAQPTPEAGTTDCYVCAR